MRQSLIALVFSTILKVDATVLDADPNRNLFARLFPVFEAEEAELVAAKKIPVLGGETSESIAEATALAQQLVESGKVSKEVGDKLIESLHNASRVKKLVSLLDGGHMSVTA
jgi:hypothetical protein